MQALVETKTDLPCCAADDGHSSSGQTDICGYGGMKITRCKTSFAVSDANAARLSAAYMHARTLCLSLSIRR